MLRQQRQMECAYVRLSTALLLFQAVAGFKSAPDGRKLQFAASNELAGVSDASPPTGCELWYLYGDAKPAVDDCSAVGRDDCAQSYEMVTNQGHVREFRFCALFLHKYCTRLFTIHTCNIFFPPPLPPPPAPPPPTPPPPLPPSPFPPTPYFTCTDWCALGGECTPGKYVIKIRGALTYVQCFFDGFRGIDTQRVFNGVKTYRHTDENSCPPGTDVWVPRTQGLLKAVTDHYGDVAARLVGIYGKANGCGGCGAPMNSDSPEQAGHWTSVGAS